MHVKFVLLVPQPPERPERTNERSRHAALGNSPVGALAAGDTVRDLGDANGHHLEVVRPVATTESARRGPGGGSSCSGNSSNVLGPWRDHRFGPGNEGRGCVEARCMRINTVRERSGDGRHSRQRRSSDEVIGQPTSGSELSRRTNVPYAPTTRLQEQVAESSKHRYDKGRIVHGFFPLGKVRRRLDCCAGSTSRGCV
jgi:hypothetical protein